MREVKLIRGHMTFCLADDNHPSPNTFTVVSGTPVIKESKTKVLKIQS